MSKHEYDRSTQSSESGQGNSNENRLAVMASELITTGFF